MKKKAQPEDPAIATIDQMLDDCLRINDLMESVLSYSRQKVENFKEVNVELLVRRIFSSMKSKFTRANVSAMVNCKSELRSAYADQRSLEQVLINIITNAYDAIKEEGGVISVQIAPSEADEGFWCKPFETVLAIRPEIRRKYRAFVSGKPREPDWGWPSPSEWLRPHKDALTGNLSRRNHIKVNLPINEIAENRHDYTILDPDDENSTP